MFIATLVNIWIRKRYFISPHYFLYFFQFQFSIIICNNLKWHFGFLFITNSFLLLIKDRQVAEAEVCLIEPKSYHFYHAYNIYIYISEIYNTVHCILFIKTYKTFCNYQPSCFMHIKSTYLNYTYTLCGYPHFL